MERVLSYFNQLLVGGIMSNQPHGLSRYESLVKHCADRPQPPLPDTFGRLGQRNPLSGNDPDGKPFGVAKVLEAFDAVVTSMEDTSDPNDHDVAAGMTFFGQFVDQPTRKLFLLRCEKFSCSWTGPTGIF